MTEARMDRRKYPRTFHVPWSPGASADDKVHESLGPIFPEGTEVVMTEKIDGENTTIYADGFTHARSVDSARHPARDWMRAFAARIGPSIPPGWRVLGENAFARHSIPYTHLPSYFLMFGVVDADDRALPWSEVEEWAQLLECATVPVLWRGAWDSTVERRLRDAARRPLPPSAFGPTSEGYVLRRASGFPMVDFARYAAKFVRAGHVQTTEHWLAGPVTPNLLAEA